MRKMLVRHKREKHEKQVVKNTVKEMGEGKMLEEETKEVVQFYMYTEREQRPMKIWI